MLYYNTYYEEINYFTFEYDKDVLTNIHSVWHSFDERGNRYVDETESITFIRADVAIIMWNKETHSRTEIAPLVNGRAASMTHKKCIFHYDDIGRLAEVESDWGGLMKLTWDGNNIKRFDYGYGSDNYSIEYTYTKHKARQLQYYFVFNPLGDNDFLDCLDEGALFYTGACGPLSENLPSQVVYKKNGVVFYTNSFQYIVDSSGYPIDALLSTDRDDMVRQWGAGLHGTMHLKITWE